MSFALKTRNCAFKMMNFADLAATYELLAERGPEECKYIIDPHPLLVIQRRLPTDCLCLQSTAVVWRVRSSPRCRMQSTL